jgi:hypothetical protein
VNLLGFVIIFSRVGQGRRMGQVLKQGVGDIEVGVSPVSAGVFLCGAARAGMSPQSGSQNNHAMENW